MIETIRDYSHRQETRHRIINGTTYRFEHSHHRTMTRDDQRTKPTDQDVESCRITVTKRVTDHPTRAPHWVVVHRFMTIGEAT